MLYVPRHIFSKPPAVTNRDKMIRSVIQRKASFLSSSKWSAETSPNIPTEEHLNTLGLRLGALIEKADTASAASRDGTQNDVFNLHACVNVVTALHVLDNSFNDWFETLHNGRQDLFWTVPDFASDAHLDGGLLCFVDLPTGLLLTTFWALKLTLSDAIQQLYNLLDTAQKRAPKEDMATSMEFVEALIEHHGREYRRKLAIDIIRGVPFCLGQQDETSPISTGLQCAQRMLYCLGLAVAALWTFGPSTEYLRGCGLFGAIMPNISFARELERRFDAYSVGKTAEAQAAAYEDFTSLDSGVPVHKHSMLMPLSPTEQTSTWELPVMTTLPSVSSRAQSHRVILTGLLNIT